MKKTLFICLATAALCYSAAALAQFQMQPEPQMQPSKQIQKPSMPAAGQRISLDERYSRCMQDTACSTKTRMQIMQEENDEMNRHFQKIHQACADVKFQNCTDPKNETIQQWQTAHIRMQQMMQSMTAQSLEKQEPAAGGYTKPTSQDGKEERRWDKIWWYKGKK